MLSSVRQRKKNMCETVEAAARSYLSSLNPLAKKIQQGCDLLTDSFANWKNLTCEQQEKVLDALVLDPDITSKYESQAKETEDAAETRECFPKLHINTGEKIVVDFQDEDVYTWRDEHSGPFSWRTKSQQDLSLLDDDFVPVPSDKSKTKAGKKSHTPDRELNFAFKPEKSIWDSPFLVAEKGLAKSDMFGSDELFQKFKLTCGGVEGSQEMLHSPTKASEESKLLSSPHHENRSFQLDEAENTLHLAETSSGCSTPRTLERTNSRDDSVDDVPVLSSRSSLDRLSSSQRRKGEKTGLSKKWRTSSSSKKEMKVEAEQSLMSVETNDDPDQGQVSPVYIEDPGESFTDDPVFTYQADNDNAPKVESTNVVTSQPQSQHETTAELEPGSFDLNTDSPMDDSALTRSGFDFLDNW